MPTEDLCSGCLELSDASVGLAPHAGLRPILELGERQLFRCRHCGAFATSPGDGQPGWSLNVMGLPVQPHE